MASVDAGNNSGWIFNTDAGPALIYNSKTARFGKDVYELQVEYPQAVLVNTSASGKVETLNVRADVFLSFAMRNFVSANATDDARRRNIMQAYMWLQRGGVLHFARELTEQALTTLSGSAAVGATTISLTNTAGIFDGDRYIIRSETALDVVKVTAVTDTTVTIVEGLNFAFSSGDRFRSEFYMPVRLVPGSEHPIREMPPLHFDARFSLMEDTNSL